MIFPSWIDTLLVGAMTESWKRTGLRAGLLLLVTVVTYLPALRDGFVWDDDFHVTNNVTLRTVHGLVRIWTEPGAVPQYYPLTHTSFWIEYHLWGLNPFGYHLVNVLLQALNAILLWLVLDRLRVRGAWLAAAIFAVHPIQIESVAWITERKNLLSGTFYLGALLAYARFCPWEPESAADTRRWRFYTLAVVLFVCALLSKTVTCTLPAVILLLLWWKRGRLGWRDALPLVPLFVIGAALGLATVWIEKTHVGASGPDWSYTMADRVLIAVRALWFYAAKLVWPFDLIFVYPHWQIDAAVWWQWLFPLAAIGAGLALWSWRARLGRGPVVAVLFFAGTLAPALGFVNVYPMRYSFVADHFQYLAGIGLIALAVAAGATALRQRVPQAMLAGTVLAALGVMSWQRCAPFHDAETLWRDTIARNPGCWMAHDNLGLALLQTGRTDEAIAQYEAALRIRPDYPEAHNNLGDALLQVGRNQEAIGHYEQALRIKPDDAESHNNLGNALLHTGKTEDAIGHFEAALRIRPDYPEAHNNLGSALVRMGKFDEAIGHYEQALRTRPDDAGVHNNLGNALIRTGKFNEAIDHYQQALRTRPDDAEVHNNLGNALLQTGKTEDAIAQYEAALRIRPDSPEAHNNLGNALLHTGKTDAAIGHFEAALRIRPNYAKAHINLADALARANRVEEAIAHYEQALRLQPGNALAHDHLGLLYAAAGNLREATAQYSEALQLKPDYADAYNNLAWLLAASEDSTAQDHEQAIQLATRANELAAGKEAGYLDTLAVAYAASDRFPEAITTAQKAVDLARSGGQSELAGRIESRLELYRAGRAYVGSTNTPSPRP